MVEGGYPSNLFSIFNRNILYCKSKESLTGGIESENLIGTFCIVNIEI